MRKITVMNDHNAYIGDNNNQNTDNYKCCGYSGYGVDIYYDADAKKPSEYMVKIATKKVLKARLSKIKAKKIGSLKSYQSLYKNKDEGTRAYYSAIDSHNKAIKECEALLEKLA